MWVARQHDPDVHEEEWGARQVQTYLELCDLDRTEAHGARLTGCEDLTVAEVVLSELLTGLPNGSHLSVGRWVRVPVNLVVRLDYDFAVPWSS